MIHDEQKLHMNLRKTKEHKQASNPWNCEIYFNE